MRTFKTILLSILVATAGYTSAQSKKNSTVEISTQFGKIKLLLYNETPLHRDNFLKLTKEKYFDGTLFHRVIKNFMIQGGDPDSKNAPADSLLGNGGPAYTIPAEIVYPAIFHKRGVLAAARESDQVNPTKASSGSQFYIVWGKVFTQKQLDSLEQKRNANKQLKILTRLSAGHKAQFINWMQTNNTAKVDSLRQILVQQSIAEAAATPDFHFTAAQRTVYTTLGGTPHLDGNYTVFGEVISGLEVVDKIQQVNTDKNDRPKQNIPMKVKIKKQYK